jgi:hypothetical protein
MIDVPKGPTRMSNPSTLSALPLDGVQSDKAALDCTHCKTAIVDAYFELNAKVVCPECREQVAAHAIGGSGAGRLLRAFAWGSLGAIAGTSLWVAITHATGYEIGLVAVVVGLLVGGGVRKGADRRGGLAYQCMAVVLTYLAIVATYVPDVHRGFMEQQAHESAPVAALSSASTDANAMANPMHANLAVDVQDDAPAPLLAIALYGALVFALAAALPFLALPENLIGLMIIGFALFEAWKMNKRTPVEFSGPFALTRERAAA